MNTTTATGTLTVVTKVLSPEAPYLPALPSWDEICYWAAPHPAFCDEVNEWRMANLPKVMADFARLEAARRAGAAFSYGRLFLHVIRADGTILPYGLAAAAKVTQAYTNYLVDAHQNLTELENLKFHGIGTGTAAESNTDTALQTELTTQYNPDNTRATGSLAEGASANIFRTVGTNTVDAAVSITEHGIFSQAATGGGTLLDRSVFAAVNLAIGDSLQTTYELTVNAEA